LTWDEVSGCDPSAFTISTVPARFAEIVDPSTGIDEAVGSLEPLLDLAAEHESAGMGDAPWPPHYAKQEGEPPRVQPSKRRTGTAGRKSTKPLVEIARAATKDEAMKGFNRCKRRHRGIVKYLEPADVLVDAMRGRFTTWTRI